MGSQRTIAEAIRYLAGTHDNDRIVIGDAEILSVDQDSRSCSVQMIDGHRGIELNNVRLMTDVDDGTLILPTIGATVTVLFSTFTAPVVISYGGWDNMILKGGDLGGLCIVPVLIKKINNLENLVNDLIEKYNIHIHAVTGSSTSTTTSQETNTIVPTQQSEIENKSITHGS